MLMKLKFWKKTFDISESIKITEKPTVNDAENNLVD